VAQEGAERDEYLIDMMEAYKSETPLIIDFARAMGGLIRDPPFDRGARLRPCLEGDLAYSLDS